MGKGTASETGTGNASETGKENTAQNEILGEQVKGLTAKVETLEAKCNDLEGQNKTLQKELQAEKEAHQNTITEASAENTDLQNRLENMKTLSKQSKPSVEHKGNIYEIIYPKVNMGEGRIVTVEDIQSSKDLVKELIEMGSGALKKVSKK